MPVCSMPRLDIINPPEQAKEFVIKYFDGLWMDANVLIPFVVNLSQGWNPLVQRIFTPISPE